MPARTSYEKTVCPSAKRVDCDKLEEICVQIFTPYERSSPSFLRRRMVGVGRPLLPEIFGQADTVGAKSSIFSRYSLIALQR